MNNKVNENKKKKPIKTIILVSVIVASLIIFGDFANFGRSHVSILEKKTCEVTSRVKAKYYIKNKYGFTPRIINSTLYIQDKMFDSSKYGESMGGATLNAENNGTPFSIYVSCNIFENKKIKDDYQAKDVDRYMYTYFYDKMAKIANNNKNIIDYIVMVDNAVRSHDYFDPNNISDEYLYLLSSIDVIVEGNNSLTESELNEIKSIGHGVIKIYNVKSKKEYEEYMKDKLRTDGISLPAYLLYSITSNVGNVDNKFNTTYYNTITENNISLITETKDKILEPVSLSELQEIISSNPELKLNSSVIQAYKLLDGGPIHIYIPSETLKKYNLYDLKLSHWRTYSYNNTIKYDLDYNETILSKRNDYLNYDFIYIKERFGSEDIIIFSK